MGAAIGVWGVVESLDMVAMGLTVGDMVGAGEMARSADERTAIPAREPICHASGITQIFLFGQRSLNIVQHCLL